MLNRAPFNALVDDDGSGSGTIWEKARIAESILDPVDADVAFRNASNTFVGDQTINGDLIVTGEINPARYAQQRLKINQLVGEGVRTLLSETLTAGMSLRHDEAANLGKVTVGNYDTQVYEPLLLEASSLRVVTGTDPPGLTEALRVHQSGGVTVGPPATHDTDPGVGVLVAANGLGSTALNADNLLTGTVADNLLSANVLTHPNGYPGGTTTFLRADGTFAAADGGGTHAATHAAGGSDPVLVTALGGYPGGTATFLRADGTFAATAGLPGGATTQIQFNDDGVFGGSSNLTFEKATASLVVGGELAFSAAVGRVGPKTVDGADNSGLRLTGGGNFGSNRGPWIELSGAERIGAGGTGGLYFQGCQTGGNIIFQTMNTGASFEVRKNSGQALLKIVDGTNTVTVDGIVVMPFVWYNAISATDHVVVASDGTLGKPTSSRRYKENIAPYRGDAALQLTPVTFTWNRALVADADAGQQPRLGLIAEDVADVDPQWASYGADQQPTGVIYEAVLAAAIAALQQVSARVATLEAKLMQ